MMHRLAVALTVVATTAWADSNISPQDAALVDRLFTAIQHQVEAVEQGHGNCAKVAAALDATKAADNKLAADMNARAKGPNADAIAAYGASKYKKQFSALHTRMEAATLGCRSDKAVAAAWKANDLATGTWGNLPPEPAPPPPSKPKPAGFDNKVKKLDAALADYKAAGDKFEGVDNDADCTARAKLIPAYAAAKKKQDAEYNKLDKATQEALLGDDTRMALISGAFITYSAARGKCAENKAFEKAARATGLWFPK